MNKSTLNQEPKTLDKNHSSIINEIDSVLSENDYSLKKKIFSLAKMEALVFSDPKLSVIYDDMAKEGENKYGYHYNETIQNMLFNDYVLNSPKYLQKYKQAIPKEKKRRDKSGINQLKKAGEKKMAKVAQSGLSKSPKKVDENIESAVDVVFLIHPDDPSVYAYFPNEDYDRLGKYKTGYAHIGQHSAIAPNYASESREATPEEYADLKSELEGLGYNLEVLNGINETTTSASSGAYAGPAAWAKTGDLMGNKKKIKKPIMTAFALSETNYLTDSSGFEKYINMLNEEQINEYLSLHDTVEYVSDRTDETPFEMDGTKWQFVNARYPDGKIDIGVYRFGHDLVYDYSRWREEYNINEDIINEHHLNDRKSKERFIIAVLDILGIESATYKAEFPKLNDDMVDSLYQHMEKIMVKEGIDPATIDISNMNDIKMDEDSQSMIGDNGNSMAFKPQPTGDQSGGGIPTGTQSAGGMSEEMDVLNEINKELEAFTTHHNNLKVMAEERKVSALVLKDRLGGENAKNFKSDLKNSGTGEIINIENELEWADQQTDIGKDPHKLSDKIEKEAIKATNAKGKEHLKNVGNSTNLKGDEIPKRNLSTEEQEEVDLYRNGLHSLVYDNKPSEEFEDRMKSDMGDDFYEKREKQIAFKGKAPMYNKDPQPTSDSIAKKVQFDKQQTGWNEREGLKETMITGRYKDILGKNQLIEFKLNEADVLGKINKSNLFELDFTGLGNTYLNRSVNRKVVVNETVVNAMNTHKFFTDGNKVFRVKNSVQSLNENTNVKPRINEGQINKMKHLLGYKPQSYVSTRNTKENRGF